MTVHEGTARFQILSLDGGGTRGAFIAAFLAAIEEDSGTVITDHFDLIAGTSTGGIIALALGLGIRPRDIVEFYTDLGPSIFANPHGWRSAWRIVRSKFPSERLEAALKHTFQDRLFGASTKRLVIPSFNLTSNDVYLFRTPHLPHLKRDYRVPAWKVAMATSAAPTYFPAFTGHENLRLVDGGVWANNPSLVALAEGAGALAYPQAAISVLNIGTVGGVPTYDSRLNTAGMVGWAKTAPQLILDATSIGVGNQMTFLLGKDRFHRMNALGPTTDLELDDINKVGDMIGRARHTSRIEMPRLESSFLAHRAAPYTPYYTAAGEA